MIFFSKDLSLLPETREVMGHFKLVFGSGNNSPAKIRPLKVWTSWISPWVPPYGILPPASLIFGVLAISLSEGEVSDIMALRAGTSSGV